VNRREPGLGISRSFFLYLLPLKLNFFWQMLLLVICDLYEADKVCWMSLSPGTSWESLKRVLVGIADSHKLKGTRIKDEFPWSGAKLHKDWKEKCIFCCCCWEKQFH
jgi:hypothetical protein